MNNRIRDITVLNNDCINYQHGQPGQCDNEHAPYLVISFDDGTTLEITVCGSCRGAVLERLDQQQEVLQCVKTGVYEEREAKCDSCGHTRTVWRRPLFPVIAPA